MLLTGREFEAVRDQFADRLFHASIAAFDLFHVYVGDRLGLYHALAERGPLTPQELADAAAIAERYAREWLQHEAVAGVLDVAADYETVPASTTHWLGAAGDQRHAAWFYIAPILGGLGWCCARRRSAHVQRQAPANLLRAR